MWWSGKLARILDPYLVVLNALPKTALGPHFIVWMGAGQGAIIVMTLAISLIVTILNSTRGFSLRMRKKFGCCALWEPTAVRYCGFWYSRPTPPPFFPP